MTIKNFKDGLFRVGDVVNIRVRRKVRGHLTQPWEFTHVLIEEVSRDQLCIVQRVNDPVPIRGLPRATIQYLWIHRLEVEDIHVVRSEAWRTDYALNSESETPRRRTRTPAMEIMIEEETELEPTGAPPISVDPFNLHLFDEHDADEGRRPR